ncbi:cation diffusion facilitator CzcD-associated flavoprotein CzcO [Novosphingobium sp. PhB165]|uniref:flavin-containing monooxygenase n=1 Tax=Novosphingobium sp. PhB165 TaxID=2485105 RepID=UPI0010EF7DDC|nr:NAD(P)/FAD-dependent oxidoreductase [Novosphingobium sp. PhB165]TCM15346.1 cation diffusion facilitator CzcD-associated flavoprotein CzcO [Novosphingobium sp. PhB165]
MNTACKPTDVPTPGEIDIPALRQRYAHERDKRLRPEGGEQYLKTEHEYAQAYEADPHMPRVPRDPISEDLDVAVLGGGFSGLMAGVHLRNAGVSTFRHIEHAGDFGGVWYWNRYPGVQCDNDAYCYMPLLEETGYFPSKKFADGFEIQRHCRRIGEQYGLYENALFHTRITALRWDEERDRWRIATDHGDDIRARFVIMCGGPLNRPKLPGIPGLHDFRGKVFHTARWDYAYTGGRWEDPVLDKLADKRVAIVGTGATSIQAVPFLGKYAKQLYVLQRTPPTVDARPNPPTDMEWARSLQPGWQKERQRNFHHVAIEGMRPGDVDQICDIWTEINRDLAAELAGEGWPDLTLEAYLERREAMDFRVMERMRRRVEAIVEDKATAEALKPWFGFNCKRPLSNDDYYPTFNRPNVKLLDVSATRGVERLTENGFVHEGTEYGIDCLICASGFEVTSDLDRRWGIGAVDGRGGQSLYENWADGYRTLHGAMSHGFPNQFFTGYVQGGFNATTIEQFSRQGYHIAYIIRQALDRGATAVEPTLDAQDAWVAKIRATAVDISKLQRECTPGYFNNEGDHKGRRWYLGESYGPGWDAFETMMQDWRDAGTLEGLSVTCRAAQAAD